jgi:hypothetical protein
LSNHLNNNQTFIQASALSKALWNISTHVTTVVFGSFPNPNNSTSSFILITHLSILHVATVHLPLIENTSSTGIKKGLSICLSGTGIYVSNAFNNSSIGFAYSGFVGSSVAFKADHLMIGVLSPS